MSSLSNEVNLFLELLNMDNDEIISKYSYNCELINWDSNVDIHNMKLIKTILKSSYSNDAFFYNDMIHLSKHNNSNLYRTILKIIDILDLNETYLDTKLSKIFLGEPGFKNCSE